MATYGRDEGGEYTIDSSGNKNYYRPNTDSVPADVQYNRSLGGAPMATLPPGLSEAEVRRQVAIHQGDAAYTNPLDQVIMDYNNAQNPGSSGGGGGGGGGTGLVLGDPQGMLGAVNAAAATALAAARLEFDKARMAAIEVPTMENQRKYQEAVIRLQDAQQTWFRDWEERKYGMDRGDQRQQFAVDQATEQWKEQNRLAAERGTKTGFYTAPEQSPNLPYSYRDDEFRRDFLSRYGRQPSNGERYWNMPEFASPSAPNPVSQAPQVSQADQAQMAQVRQMAERDLGRGMSEPEWQTYLTGRFSADHPLVLQGKYKSGDLLSKFEQDLGRPMRINQYRQYLPESVQANYGRQTGTPTTGPGQRDVGTLPGEDVALMGGQESNMQPWQEGLLGQGSNPYQQLQADPAIQQARQAEQSLAARVQVMRQQGASEQQLQAFQSQEYAKIRSVVDQARQAQQRYEPQIRAYEQSGQRQSQNAYQGGQNRDATQSRQYDPRRYQTQGGQMPGYGSSNYGGGYNPYDSVTVDPMTGKRTLLELPAQAQYYNQTGNLVGGQRGLLGRQQDMSEEQQRWLQEYQRGQAIGRYGGEDTLGGRAQGLAETQADRDWQYKQASLQSNPANAAMVEALGNRGNLRTQGLLGQQGGRTQAADPRSVNPYSLDRLSPDQSSVLDSYSRASGRTPEDYRYEANKSRPQGQYAGRARWR